MKHSPIITLTTDFGLRDGYVAAMKGVILGIRPDAVIVDISHDVPPHDVPHAAFVVGATCRYFPPDSVHVAVVDPGVGTARLPIVLTTPHGVYVAPDNGVLTYPLTSCMASDPPGTISREGSAFLAPSHVTVPKDCASYALDRREYWRETVSNTFHGRDIFAPVAAHLSSGTPPEELGTPVGRLLCLDGLRPIQDGNVTRGHIISVDRFGNLISNIAPGGPGRQ